MNDIQQEFRDGAEAYAQQLREARERRDNPGKAHANNADLFATAMNARLEALREESGLSDLTGK
ncbi:MAG: hypothetical protein L0G94_15220 [Brachybacterium sp.]|uniref:hypothetical protein n=1 Tax=Brachybacterium sp. TaxID=1891286 RepID=UPI002647692E|nr:hypothetical protein [Brachybacterium sp.]MDN5688008.1 hypothetical protein [Brachybacterium sp.]